MVATGRPFSVHLQRARPAEHFTGIAVHVIHVDRDAGVDGALRLHAPSS